MDRKTHRQEIKSCTKSSEIMKEIKNLKQVIP